MQSMERSRQEAAHVAGHELGHDVHVARSLLDELAAALPTGAAKPRQLAQQLRRALERLDLDIDRLLIGHGGGLDTLRREPTNLGRLVMHVVHAHPTGSQPVEVDAAQVVFNLDPVKVERILDNLISNALVHTPDNCPVRVRATVEPGGAILEVEDEGPGLSAADRDALLSAREEPPQGKGLGLWIVERFASLHGGQLRIEQPPSRRGARFVVWLPAQGP